MSNDRHRVVVGVDFGTTFSGLAYLHTKDPDHKNIQVIKTWPGRGNVNLDKAPTEINYTADGASWGYQQATTQRYGFFKLLLDAKASATQYDNPRLAPSTSNSTNLGILLPPKKTAEEVTTDYLKLLYAHLLSYLKQKLLHTLNNTPIQFVLTTPAIWSHEAQNATFQAAEDAGFMSRPGDTLVMVSEPEAAASYCLKEIYHERRGTESPLEPGDRIVICDAGGGTVDLITYTVDRVDPQLRLHEAAVGSGGKCGSVAVDRAFQSLLESRIDGFEEWPARKTDRESSLMRAFDAAKREFGITNRTEPWRIPLGNVDDDPDNGIEDGELRLTVEDMKSLFDPIVQKVISLIVQQIRDSNKMDPTNKVSTIFLVGGFGESEYLFEKVIAWTRLQTYNIKVISPTFSWSAVVRGAVLYGIDGIVHTRKLKQHYGVIIATKFEPGVHDEKDAFVDKFDGTKYSRNNVEWLAAKGDNASVDKVVSIPCHTSFGQWDQRTIRLSLVGCKFDNPPVSASHWMVDSLGTITCDMSSMPPSAFQIRRSGFLFLDSITRASFSVDMTVGSADLQLNVVHAGKSYKNASIQY